MVEVAGESISAAQASRAAIVNRTAIFPRSSSSSTDSTCTGWSGVGRFAADAASIEILGRTDFQIKLHSTCASSSVTS